MLSLTGKIWVVQLSTASRLAAGLVFASLAFQQVPRGLLVSLYLIAISSDLIDGYLARRLKVTTYVGKVLDLVSDKSLTMISLLYAAAKGITLLPLALIGSREIITIGIRIIVVDGSQLLPTSRILGGFLALLIWGSTLILIFSDRSSRILSIVTFVYWASALLCVSTFMFRVRSNIERIKTALERDL
jgi:phosphatidylglycerophosphate synthase